MCGMIQTDCFGYLNGKCGVLTETVCAKTECKFYKTPEQLNEERMKSLQRHIRLGYVVAGKAKQEG